MKLEVLIAEPNRQRVRDKVKETLKKIEDLKVAQAKKSTPDAIKELAEIEKLLNEIEQKGKEKPTITDDEIEKFLESIK